MSKISYIDGPWEYHVGQDYVRIFRARLDDNSEICEYRAYYDASLPPKESGLAEIEAHARLMASSPELVRLLGNMVHALNAAMDDADRLMFAQKIEVTRKAAINLIAKATGAT